MKRLYDAIIKQHFEELDLMLFLAGPRQVGKTTAGKAAQALTTNYTYLNWDNFDHRNIILSGPSVIAEYAKLDQLQKIKPLILLDEIHKYKEWKSLLKGFYDTYKNETHILVTGSARLDIYKSGGDSLMGRYFPFRMHPLSVGECISQSLPTELISKPRNLERNILQKLLDHGGFPKPFLRHEKRFTVRWQQLRQQQLIQEDIRDLSKIQEVNQLEVLTELIKHQAGQVLNYSNLAKKVRVANDTIRRWIKTLEAFYYCYTITPWSKNITRSLIKEPKVYLWDWSVIDNPGARYENFIASHLLKAIHYWNDQGYGKFCLHYLRDLEKREVDFIVIKDEKPWFLVEAKSSNNHHINKNLYYFQEQTNANHAFQVVLELPFVEKSCFDTTNPTIVPALSLLSQLV